MAFTIKFREYNKTEYTHYGLFRAEASAKRVLITKGYHRNNKMKPEVWTLSCSFGGRGTGRKGHRKLFLAEIIPTRKSHGHKRSGLLPTQPRLRSEPTLIQRLQAYDEWLKNVWYA